MSGEPKPSFSSGFFTTLAAVKKINNNKTSTERDDN
jgi:hypothetical protein